MTNTIDQIIDALNELKDYVGDEQREGIDQGILNADDNEDFVLDHVLSNNPPFTVGNFDSGDTETLMDFIYKFHCRPR